MTLRHIAERFGVNRSVARRWLLKEGYEFVEVRDRQRGNQVVAALPIDIAADALHRRNKQGFAVVGLKAEKGIVTEDELRAQAVLQDVTSAESRRRARERDDWVDEVSGYILDEKDHGAFAEAADYIQDIEKFVSEAIEHSDGYGNRFDLIGIVRTIVDDYGDLHGDAANMVLLGLQVDSVAASTPWVPGASTQSQSRRVRPRVFSSASPRTAEAAGSIGHRPL